jgi:soluble lytic murein transglycosylase-like protein
MSNTNRAALMIAGQVRELATDEVIAWGKAVLAAEADKENEGLKKAAGSRCQSTGSRGCTRRQIRLKKGGNEMLQWILVLIGVVTVSNSPYAERYPEIAEALVDVAQAFPIDNKDYAVERTTVEIVSIVSFESSFNPDALGDHNTSIGLGQISVSNLAWLEQETGHPWTEEDLHDPRKNLEATARLLRASHRTCRAWPALQQAAAYATGKGLCNVPEGVVASRHRLERAMKLLKEHPLRWIDHSTF